MKKKIRLEVKHLAPISVNKCWQGRRYKTREYNIWRQQLELLLPRQEMIEGEVEVEVRFWIKKYKQNDVDNFAKPFLDSLVRRGYIEDDRKIIKLTLEKFPTQGTPRIELGIKKYVKKS